MHPPRIVGIAWHEAGAVRHCLLSNDDDIAGVHLFPGHPAQHQPHHVALPRHVDALAERFDAHDRGIAHHGRTVRTHDDRGITAPARPYRSAHKVHPLVSWCEHPVE